MLSFCRILLVIAQTYLIASSSVSDVAQIQTSDNTASLISKYNQKYGCSSITNEEKKLVNLMNQYRAQQGKPPVPVYAIPTISVKMHMYCLKNLKGIEQCNTQVHSWGVNSNLPDMQWKKCCYSTSNPACMWEKGHELFPQAQNLGMGYEISVGGGAPWGAQISLNAWKTSPPHNAVIVSSGYWKNWPAFGVAIRNGTTLAFYFDNVATEDQKCTI